MDEQERRIDRRLRVSVPTFRIRSGGDEPVEMLEASFRGVLLRFAMAPRVRELIKLRVDLPAGRLVVHAFVVRIVGDATRGICGMRMFAIDGNEWQLFIQASLREQKRAA